MRLHIDFGLIVDEVEYPLQPQINPKGGFVYSWKNKQVPL